jgi:hypothetical protein
MTNDKKVLFLDLSPNVRLRMTVAEEMRLDPQEEVFNDALHDKYISMHREAANQQNAALKTLMISDLGLALLLFGKNIKIPGTDFGIQDIPAANEVLTVAATFGFLTLSMAFLNSQCYQAILEQFYIRRAAKWGIDPDFLAFGNIFSQVYLKAFRRKMNSFGIDFFDPGKPYVVFYSFLLVLLILSWLSILALHLCVVAAGALQSVSSHWLSWIFVASIMLMHVVGISINLLPDFRFRVEMTSGELARERLSEEIDVPTPGEP